MRVIFDANILIRYLLNRSGQGLIRRIVVAAGLGDFELLVPEELLAEVVDNCAKGKLVKKVRAEEVAEFIVFLQQVGEHLPALLPPFPAYTRDLKDDYLIAHALRAHADYVVSADNDLLVLGQVESVQILSPAAFSALLRQAQAT